MGERRMAKMTKQTALGAWSETISRDQASWPGGLVSNLEAPANMEGGATALLEQIAHRWPRHRRPPHDG